MLTELVAVSAERRRLAGDLSDQASCHHSVDLHWLRVPPRID